MAKNLSCTPIPLDSPLGSPKTHVPRYGVKVKCLGGETEVLGDPRATRALLVLMNQHAIIGGAACHWGGPSAFAEIMSSLHGIMFREERWFDHYHFVNDAGHTENGIYALRANYDFAGMTFDDLKGFRSVESNLTGHGESHVNPTGVYISNGPLGSGIGQAQGLALAEKLSQKNRTTLCTISDGACMEGEAKEALAAIPGLAGKKQLGSFLLLISDNNTKLTGPIDQNSFSMEPTFKSLETLGWKVQRVEDGHNLQQVHGAIEKGLEQVKKNPLYPVALVFKTIKGKGISFTETSPSGGHGYPFKAYDSRLSSSIGEVYGDAPPPQEFMDWAEQLMASRPTPTESKKESNPLVPEKVQAGIGRGIIAAAKENFPVISVSSDLQGSTGIGEFYKKFPHRCFDIGVAEANMISTAIGLSKEGYIPIVDTFAQFGITKGGLPIIMSSLSQAPIIALFSHTGFQDAADGASHQATTYFSALAGIPQTTLINCSCSGEAQYLIYQTIKEFHKKRMSGDVPDSTIFFMGRETFPPYYEKSAHYGDLYSIGTTGKDITLIASGPMVSQMIAAQALLKENKIEATVLSVPFINKTNIPRLIEFLDQTNGCFITLEDHQVIGGQGSLICHALTQAGYSFKARSLGIEGHFGRSAYKALHLYERFDLTPKKVLTTARILLNN